jgi:putative flippase GtrA
MPASAVTGPNLRKLMAPVPNRLFTVLRRKIRGTLGTRFARFAGAAAGALTATEVALTVCTGVLHLTATPAALISWFAGAVVSYGLSRWAWNRKGKPDVLRETIPFWAISGLVIVLLTLANKLGYHSAGWLHLTGAKHVLWVDFVWLVANFGTFLLRFAVFHFVLFTDRAAAPGTAGGPSGRRPAGSPAPRHAKVPGAQPPAEQEPAPLVR